MPRKTLQSNFLHKTNSIKPVKVNIDRHPIKSIFGSSDIGDNYWKSKFTKQRASKRQKTISMKGTLFLESKIDILYNFAYSINDYFWNANFNMNRLKCLNFEDLKNNLRENNVIFKQLNQMEKREYIKQRKILKAKQIELKNKRIQELQNEGKPFSIIKIKNECTNLFVINWPLKYTEQEISMAKKCILNNWKYPPPDFFSQNFKKYEEPQINNDKIVKKRKINALDWTRQNYVDLIGGDLSIYEKNDIKEPLQKDISGSWLNFTDLISLFNSYLILYNPCNIFTAGKILIDDNWSDYKVDCYEPLDDFKVLKFDNELIENKDQKYSIFIIFQPNNEKTLKSRDKINNYIIFDIEDEKHNTIYKNITLNKFYSTYYIQNLNGNSKYYMLIRGGIYQFGYFLEFYSQGHKIENMTYQTYLSQTYDYNITNFKIEHPLIGKDNFYLLTRLHILYNTEENQVSENEIGDIDIIINIKYPLKYLKKFIKFFIQKEGTDSNTYNKGKQIYANEKISLKKGEYLIAVYFQDIINSIKENSCDINIAYSNKNYKIEQIENIDYYKIGDEYKPNKYNIVFKEKIYACDKIYASFNIKVNHVNDTNTSNEKLKLIFLLYQLADKDNIDIPLIDKRFSYELRGNLIQKFES